MIHTYSIRLRIMVFWLLGNLWCWWIYHLGQSIYEQRFFVLLFGLPLTLALIFATLLAIWSLSAIEADASGIRILFLGFSLLSFPWRDIKYVQKIVDGTSSKVHSAAIKYFIFSKNAWLPVTFSETISDFILLLTTVNTAAAEHGFDLYEVTQGRSLRTKGIFFERNHTPRGQVVLRF